MSIPRGFIAAKQAVIAALQSGLFQHEARRQIDLKNLLQAGAVSPAEVEAIVRRAKGSEHQCSPHHQAPSVDVHLIVSQGSYIKFYFIDDPDTMFISVHR